MILVGMLLAISASASIDPARALPTVFEAGRVYAVPELKSGQVLKLLVDTGGGGAKSMYWINADVAKQLKLATHICKLGSGPIRVTGVPRFKRSRDLPMPLNGPCGTAVMLNPEGASGIDGQLGAGYLPGRIWTIDYPDRQLLEEPATWKPAKGTHSIPMGFLRDRNGTLLTGFPRIVVQIDGKPLDMLLDTGATGHPTEAGLSASHIATVNGFIATSYITTTMLNQWHKAHTDWPVVVEGDNLFPHHPSRTIRVPVVAIAGIKVGPVWFTERPDRAFHQFMASMMDKQTEGAIGGNILKHFVMTLDYPRATVDFDCSAACLH